MLVIYLSIELQGLCFYTLCVINRSANGATEAAIKYLLMSGLASSLLLFGTSLRYGETGTTNLSLWLELTTWFSDRPSGLLEIDDWL